MRNKVSCRQEGCRSVFRSTTKSYMRERERQRQRDGQVSRIQMRFVRLYDSVDDLVFDKMFHVPLDISDVVCVLRTSR